MKLSMINDFDCDPDMLWEIFESEEFDRRLEDETGVRREVMEESTGDDGILHKRLRCITLRELPTVMKKAMGTDHLEFEQINRLDLQKSQMEWTVRTPVLTDRVDARGITLVEKTPTGARRILDGEIIIRLPVVGKRIEEKLGSNIRESYEKAADIARQMIEERAQH